MRLMNFQFCEKSSPATYVSELAGRLRVSIFAVPNEVRDLIIVQDYPLSECLFGKYDMREFRPDLIAELLDAYLIPKRMR